MQHSGWNDDDYYNATVKAYYSSKDDFNMMDGKAEEKILHFEFKEEWEILKTHQKWRATLSKQEMIKRKSSGSSPTSSDDWNDSGASDERNGGRPSGVKKAKAIQSLTVRTESLIEELKQQKTQGAENQKSAVSQMMSQMKEDANANIEKLERIVSESTNKLTRTLNMKLLLQSDLSQMSSSFQEKARKAIEKHFEDTVLQGTIDDQEAGDDAIDANKN